MSSASFSAPITARAYPFVAELPTNPIPETSEGLWLYIKAELFKRALNCSGAALKIAGCERPSFRELEAAGCTNDCLRIVLMAFVHDLKTSSASEAVLFEKGLAAEAVKLR